MTHLFINYFFSLVLSVSFLTGEETTLDSVRPFKTKSVWHIFFHVGQKFVDEDPLLEKFTSPAY